MSPKDELGEADDFYYAFVKLNDFVGEPDFWIIPSKVVCPLIKPAYLNWERTPGGNGEIHNPSTIRWLPVSADKYYPDDWSEEVKRYYKNLDQLQ